MKKRKLKPFVVPIMYIASIAMLLGSVYFIERLINQNVFQNREEGEVQDVVRDNEDESQSSL